MCCSIVSGIVLKQKIFCAKALLVLAGKKFGGKKFGGKKFGGKILRRETPKNDFTYFMIEKSFISSFGFI
jgi:hypothetical protein